MEDRLEIEKHEDVNVKGQFVTGTGKPNSGKGSRLLQHLNTRISIGTEVNFKSKIIFNHILTKIIKRMVNMFMSIGCHKKKLILANLQVNLTRI